MKKQIAIWILFIMIITTALYGNHAMAAVLFPDLKGHWSEHVINTLVRQSVITGFPDGTIKPNATITRAEYACLVARITGHNNYNPNTAPSFSDISNCWAKRYIEALVSAGAIEHSYYGATLRPSEPITRMEMTRILVNAIGRGVQARTDNNRTTFTDDHLISHFDKGYVNAAKKYGIVNGYPDGRFDPNKGSTRAEAFVIVSRFKSANDKAVIEDKEAIKDGESSITGESGKYPNMLDGSHNTSLTGSASDNQTDKQTSTPTPKPIPSPPTTPVSTPVPKPTPTPTPKPTPTPVTQIKIELSSVGYTDVPVDISVDAKNAKSFSWKIDKLNGNGDVEATIWESGELFSQCNIEHHFTESGTYKLTAQAENLDGKLLNKTAEIEILTPENLFVEMPDTAHIDTDIDVKALQHSLSVRWTFRLDEINVDMPNNLDDNGGILRLKEKGVYTVEAVGMDKYGRKYETSAYITVYPVPTIDFELPDILHTDTDFNLSTTLTDTDGLEFMWSMTRDNADVQVFDCIDGDLTDEGGSIRFLQKGIYELKAKVADVTGRVFSTFKSVTVLPVPVIEYSLPKTMHTDIIHDMAVVMKETDNVAIDWSLTHDGKQIEMFEFLTNADKDTNGSVSFLKKGNYTLSVCATDVTGRKFTHSAYTTVYPVPSLDFDVTPIQYVDEPVIVNTSFDEADYPVVWTMTKDAGAALTNSVEESLTKDGGNFRINEKGNYKLTASMTDPTGRTFTTNRNVKIIVELNCDFDVVSRTHIKPDIAVSMKKAIDDYDGVTQWTLVKSGSAASYTGGLNNGGGSFRVSNTGSYTLTATVTDALGKTSTCSRNVDVYNNPPAKPKIILPDDTSDNGAYHTGTIVKITAESTDPDGDTVSYVWENRERENNDYPYGWHTVRCKAVDQFGAESGWESATFLSAITTDWNKLTIDDFATAVFSSGISPYAKRVSYVVGLNKDDRRPNDKIIIYAHNRSTGKYDNINEFAPGDNTHMQGSVDPAKYDKLEAQIYPYDGGLKGKEMQFNVFIKYK